MRRVLPPRVIRLQPTFYVRFYQARTYSDSSAILIILGASTVLRGEGVHIRVPYFAHPRCVRIHRKDLLALPS